MKAYLEVVELNVNDVVTTSGGYNPDDCTELDLPDV